MLLAEEAVLVIRLLVLFKIVVLELPMVVFPEVEIDVRLDDSDEDIEEDIDEELALEVVELFVKLVPLFKTPLLSNFKSAALTCANRARPETSSAYILSSTSVLSFTASLEFSGRCRMGQAT